MLRGCLAAIFVAASLSAQDVRDTAGPLETLARPASADNPIPRKAFSVAAIYPPEASGFGASGRVDFVVTVDDSGRVTEIRKLRDPISISATGTPGSPAALYAASDAFIREAATAVRRWTYDSPTSGPIRFFVEFSFKTGSEAVATEYVTRPLRVGSGGLAPRRIKHVAPIYPAAAQQARVTGTVIVEATVGVDGKVADAKVLRGIPLLDQAALDAVRQWEYTRTLFAGEYIQMIIAVTVTFP